MIHFRENSNAFGVTNMVQDTGDVYNRSAKRQRIDPFKYDCIPLTSLNYTKSIPAPPLSSSNPHSSHYNLQSSNNQLTLTTQSKISYDIKLNGTIEYTVDYLRATINSYIEKCKDNSGVITIPLGSNNETPLIIPNGTQIINSYFLSETTFLQNFKKAFSKTILEVWPKNSDIHKGVMLTLKKYTEPSSVSTQKATYLDLITLSSFRQLVCILFNKLFSIKLACCSCYPLNESEFMAWQSGVYKNCYSKDCDTYLRDNPFTYDSLFVGSCADIGTSQIAISYIRATASQNLQINVHIKQMIEDFVETNKQS